MKYKVGDKVKVRSDLNYEKYSEGVPFTSEMDKFKGTVLEVRKIAGGFYEMVGIPHIFTDEMLEPVEGMSAEEAIRLYAKMCKDNNCYACPVYEKSGECGCEEFAINHPEEVIESLKQWKEDHEKKPIETEHVMCIVVMDEKRNVVYEEKTNGVIVTTDMEEVLKKYCSEHDGKYYAISERRCVVKE
nr:MAG TPA: hypothetical protein [Caudoviricetes sp.]